MTYIPIPVEDNGGVPVNIQDQVTPLVIGNFSQSINGEDDTLIYLDYMALTLYSDGSNVFIK